MRTVLAILLACCLYSCLPQENKPMMDQVSSEGQLSDGKFHGPLKYYYPDGTLKSSTTYNKGRKDGQDIAYYPNGGIAYDRQFKNDEKTDEAYFYYENGLPQTFIYYHHEDSEVLYRRDYTQTGAIDKEDGALMPVTYINKFEPNLGDTLRVQFYLILPPLTTNRFIVDLVDVNNRNILCIDTTVLKNPFIIEEVMKEKGSVILKANFSLKNEVDKTDRKCDFSKEIIVK